MTAIEDPAAQPSSEPAATGQKSDELEHWLSGLRTEVAVDPPGWIDEASGSEHPSETSTPDPSRVGRHRAAD
jgi:hypothetical protein